MIQVYKQHTKNANMCSDHVYDKHEAKQAY